MNLQFTGILPWYVLLPLFVVVIGLTVFLYIQHRLPRPWNFILPAIRIVALTLLMLMLLQPVFSRIHKTIIRGQIPIVVDTSGSMDTVDDYPPHRQIEIGWNLKLYPRDLRATVFTEAADDWAELGKALTAAERGSGSLRSAIDRGDSWTRSDVSDFKEGLRTAGRELDRYRKTLQGIVDEVDYLQLAPAKGPRGVTWVRFDGIPGSDVRSLTSAASYPSRPSATGTASRLESRRNQGDEYGLMLHGFLRPPLDGKYEFTKVSDDGSEFWLSHSADPAQTTLFMNTGQGLKSTHLKKDQLVYFRVLLKEGSGDDYVKIGWKRPDGKSDEVIPGDVLLPMGEDDAQGFVELYPPFAAGLDGISETFKRLEGELEDIGDATNKMQQSLSAFRGSMDAWRSFRDHPEALQKAADEALALAGVAEVDAAIERLSEMKRSDLVRFLLADSPFKLADKLDAKGEVSVYSFAEAPEPVTEPGWTNLVGDLAATRLGSVLGGVLNRYEKMPVGGVVLITDGNNNAGKPLAELRQSLEEREIPLFALGIGSEEPPPDISIARVSAPRTSFLDDTMNISVALHRHGHTEVPIRVRVMAGEEEMATQLVEPGEDAETVVDLAFVEKEAGTRAYRVIAQPEISNDDQPGPRAEAFDHNNEKSVTVSVLEDRIKTLCIDEFPRWETRYANMMLKRDKRVDLDTIFVASSKDGNLPTGEGGYPASREALFAYHIVILGDVNPRHFTTEQMNDLRDFVIERGGTIIAMAGQHHMPSGYSGTPLADALPLNQFGRGSATNLNRLAFSDAPLAFKDGAYQPAVLEEGLFEDLLQIGRNPEATRELWDQLPRLSWLKEDVTSSRSSDGLVEAKAMRGDSVSGSAPVLVKAYAGLGKTLYIGSDSFWRWRYRARWTYHHRFWGQILLWSTMGRTTGSDPNVKLMADRPMYAPEEPITIKVRLFDEQDLPLVHADAEIEVYDEANEMLKRIPLAPIENSGGEYRAEIRDLPRGRFKVVPRVQELAHLKPDADVYVEVRDLPTSEYVDLALDTATLETLTDKVLPFDEALSVLDEIEAIRNEERKPDPIELWNSFPWLLAIGLLLALEWLLRKRCKLA